MLISYKTQGVFNLPVIYSVSEKQRVHERYCTTESYYQVAVMNSTEQTGCVM